MDIYLIKCCEGYLEGPVGLEPTTPCLKGRCSNRLSYGPIMIARTNYTLHYPAIELIVNQKWIGVGGLVMLK